MRTEVKRLIEAVSKRLRYDSKWANDDVSIFLTLLDNPAILFHQSKEQGVVLFRDNNLIIYAVLWEWVLVRKLKRLQMEGQVQRQEDWNDCVTITKLLCDRSGGKLNTNILKRFDHTDREPPVLPKTIVDLRRLIVRLGAIKTYIENRLPALATMLRFEKGLVDTEL